MFNEIGISKTEGSQLGNELAILNPASAKSENAQHWIKSNFLFLNHRRKK